jgi:hypothetical protein
MRCSLEKNDSSSLKIKTVHKKDDTFQIPYPERPSCRTINHRQ